MFSVNYGDKDDINSSNRSKCRITYNKTFFLFDFTDKVKNVRIDLDNKKVYVTSEFLSADEILETIKKTGKTTCYVGVAK